MITSDQAAAKWATNLAGSTQSITDGVNAVTVAPGQAAARQADAYLAGVQANVGKWKSRVAGVTLQSWQQSMINKGIPRIASGAQQAQPKFAAFMAQAMPVIQSAVQSLPARGNLEQNLQRSNQFARKMAAWTYQPTGS